MRKLKNMALALYMCAVSLPILLAFSEGNDGSFTLANVCGILYIALLVKYWRYVVPLSVYKAMYRFTMRMN